MASLSERARASSPGAERPRKPGMKEIKPLLQDRVRDLAEYLAPGGHYISGGRIYMAPNPTRSEKHGTSFCIWIRGVPGSWVEYDSGEKGDIYQLIEYCLSNINGPKESFAWARKWLGIDGALSPEDLQRRQEEAATARAARDREEAERRHKRIRQARAIWLSGGPLVRKSAAWSWLQAGRNLPIGRLQEWQAANLPAKKGFLGAVHVAPSQDYYWPPGDVMATKHPELAAMRPASGKSSHPAMLVALAPADGGRMAAVHRTFLSAQGYTKADVPLARMVLGAKQGCVAMIWPGETGLPTAMANKRLAKTPLLLAEGVEDAIGLACAIPEARVWAIIDAGNLMSLTYPACASEIVMFRDNDLPRPGEEQHPAARAVDNGLRRLAAFGPVRAASLENVKDVNALYQEADQ